MCTVTTAFSLRTSNVKKLTHFETQAQGRIVIEFQLGSAVSAEMKKSMVWLRP